MRSEDDIRKKIETLTKHLEETEMSSDQKKFTDGIIVGLKWVLADEGYAVENGSRPRSR